MDLYPSDDDEAIRAASEAYLRDHLPLSEARARPAGTWAGMAEMGWFGIALPETAGGTGMGHGPEALVFAELGRVLAPVGAIAAAVAASAAGATGDAALAREIAGGGIPVALGIADPAVGLRVFDAGAGGLVTVVDDRGFALHEADGGWAIGGCIDLTAAQAVVAVPRDEPRVRAEGASAARHQRLLAAAYALGCAEAARDMATGYAKAREQFGKPIGAFQAIKHLCADMAVRASAARAQLLYAALSVDAGAEDAAFQIAAAKRMADTAAVANGRAAIQVHGGIGMTDDYDAHLLLKRAHLLSFVSPVTTALLLA